MRTSVAIIGAGPAGLLLARLLQRQGIESVVLESRSREHVEHRQRAGILEQGTVDVLRSCGAGERMDREGLPHDGIELRFGGAGHRIDMAALTGGRQVMVYAQTEVVRDLVALRIESGAPLLFDAEVSEVRGADTAHPRVHYRRAGAEHVLDADYVVGADGFHGVARKAIPAERVRTYERTYPFAWLGILADVAPSTEELIYASHERGFALHSMRTPQVSRLYLQVPPDTDVRDWPDERIWDELDVRFAVDGDWRLERGPITDKSVTPMRSFVAEPLRYGRLLLAGDAAHIVPPTGAKGLNLAVADVALLAQALTAALGRGDDRELESYSDTALRRVWRAEHFSYFMTTLLHADPAADDFARRLQRSHLDHVVGSTAAATSLAENYVGFPLGAEL
ncbi:4-hydroxybenzoate 3-monooxygenase [Saccharopolyspora sp. NFXS83]|uniref:4-hydroxybenzoate 3-monooxygenase n=1 Tax=Saccharopolyspora sp. NFXS83 TaxID=2993560 RepID=UPI00224AAFF4|nr:4-hydroxybenzoate 3-monooxygenase [Saccharopolyspora sp. NFXS83]MCX2730039.1 4-hydroxybenzoate 3-monooxygenase [Saccharopolyspora sp. NFXS83]